MSPAAERSLPTWWVAMVVALPATLGAFSGAYRRAFDAWVHLFFADHYLRGWFSTWEPRWYGGFSVLSYPPLAHQLLAGAAAALGHELGFVALMGAAMVTLPFAARAFARQLVGGESAAWVLVFVALWPTSHRFAYVYGQLPLLVATPLALFAMTALCRWFDTGGFRWLAQFALFAGATAGAHHVSSIFVAMGCAIVGFDRLLRHGRAELVKALARGAAAAALGVGAIALTIYPFLAIAAAPPQAEIPHISRDPMWLRPFGVEVGEQLAIVLVGAVGLVVAAIRWRRGLGLTFGVLFFGLLSFGLTTRLPALLFRDQARWLTYDKFHHWAAVWCAVVLAGAAARFGRTLAIPVALLLLPPTLLNIGHKQSAALQPEYLADLGPLLAVVNTPDAHQYRHLTLGFGDQFCRLSIFGKSPNVDGDYHTARGDPVLRLSGVATLDASKYYPKGKEVLEHVLGRADALSLRWVFVNDAWYFDSVLAAGFELREVWENGVTLFERSTVPSIASPPIGQGEEWGWFWGTVPLLVFVLAVLLALSSAWARRSAAA